MYKVKRFSSEKKDAKMERNAKGLATAGTALGALAAKDAVSAANSFRKAGGTFDSVKGSWNTIKDMIGNHTLDEFKAAKGDAAAKYGAKSTEAMSSKAMHSLKRASNRAKGAGAALLAAGTLYGVKKGREYMRNRKAAKSEEPMY